MKTPTENTIVRETGCECPCTAAEPPAKSVADASSGAQTETDLEPIARSGGDSWVLQVGSFEGSWQGVGAAG